MSDRTEKFRLLVVNDNPVTLEMMRNILRHHTRLLATFEVLADNALERIQKESPYHIIITDLTTPYFTGIDVLKAARAKSPDTKVLMITSFGNHQVLINAIKAGVYDYLHKPFRPDELNLKLQNATRFFQLKSDYFHLRDTHVKCEEDLAEQRRQMEAAQEDIQTLRTQLDKYEPADKPLDLEGAIAKAVAHKGDKLQTYNLYRKLTDLETLLEEKKISDDEFQNMRKTLLEKVYQAPTA